MELPKLRYVEFIPVVAEDQQHVLLRDPENLADGMVVLSMGGFLVATMLTGENSVVDIQTELMRRFGELVPREQIEGIINALDQHLLLDNERYRAHYSQLVDEFRKSSLRKAICAGASYKDDPDALRAQINGYFEAEGGPGRLNGRVSEVPIKGLIAPHIDFDRGGPCYAHVYRKVTEAPRIDTFVILGTAHGGLQGHYAFTKKSFETPLGVINTDTDFIGRLEEKLGKNLCEEEFAHRSEHSVELQVVFIQAQIPREEWPAIVPVLCSGLTESVTDGALPSDMPEIKDFINALRETIEESSKRVCLLASADLSHVGPRFGDEQPVTQASLQQLAKEDMELITEILEINPEGFIDKLRKDKNQRNVCSVGAIFTLLSAADASTAELLQYAQAPDPQGAQCVTFCGVTMH